MLKKAPLNEVQKGTLDWNRLTDRNVKKFPLSEVLMNSAKARALQGGVHHNSKTVEIQIFDYQAFDKAKEKVTNLRFPLKVQFERVTAELPTGKVDIWEPLNAYAD
jgi:hypothetical protein